MPVLSAILSPVLPSFAFQNPVQSPRRFEESHPVLDEIIRLGPGPVSRWALIETLEPDLGGDRRDLRERRAEVFRQIDRMVQRGQLMKLGRYRLLTPDSGAASTADAADNRYRPRRNAALRRRSIAIPRNRSVQFGTANNDCRAPKPPNPVPEAVSTNKIVANCLPAQVAQLELPKPNPTDAEISEASRALAKRRGFRKRWSGFVNGERVWRGREIELPDGTRAYAYGARGGVVIWSLDPARLPGGNGKPLGWGALPQEHVRLVRCAAAQILGRLKAGVRERPSPAKAVAVRVNGCMPPRPGSRPRGRPRMVRESPAP